MIPTTPSNRERRDWTLLIFIIPIGILLMLAAGQFAIRLVPEWSVKAGMQSNLDPNNLPKQQNVAIQPVLPAILTPLGWLDTFLTPGAGSDNQVVFPPFVVFEPSATPEVTLPPPTAATQPSPTVPTSTPPTAVVTPPPATETETSKPPDGGTPTPPTATPPTATPPTATPPTPVPTATGTPSTPPAGTVLISPPPELDANVPPDGNAAGLPSLPLGSYTIVDLTINGNPVHVSGTPDGMYDLIFYESEIGPGSIYLDHIIIGISTVDDGSYYEVFYWGDNDRDENTNVDFNTLPPDTSPSCTEPECDNRVIPTTELHTDTANPSISTGILIDVDNAPGKPPEGDYRYVVIISPPSGDFDNAQVDAIVVEEVPP